MKKLLMLFGVVAMIHITGAFGAVYVPCTIDYNCGDGIGQSGSYEVGYTPVSSQYRTVPENNSCSKPGSQFDHWAVTMTEGTPSSPVAYPGELYDLYGCDADNHLILTAVYVSNGVTTSKPYVDDKIATKQLKIPAAGQSGVGLGDSVITYTGTAGTIGERQLFTGENTYTAGDADKLITAAALNNTFTNLPTTDTTKLECANQSGGCTLWTIIDQTAYGDNSNSCKAYGETTSDSSECCSGNFDPNGEMTIDRTNGTITGLCGCVTDNDCGPRGTCHNDGECTVSF